MSLKYEPASEPQVQSITERFKDRCIQEKILPASFWNKRTAKVSHTR